MRAESSCTGAILVSYAKRRILIHWCVFCDVGRIGSGADRFDAMAQASGTFHLTGLSDRFLKIE